MRNYKNLEEDPFNAPGFTDIDNLLDQWREYVASELEPFKVVQSDMYGKGCVCDLQKIFEQQNFTPDYVMSLIPRVKDCYTGCINSAYNSLLQKFLQPFVNLRGDPMTINDLGEDEPSFFEQFLYVANQRVIFNSWDLFRSGKNYNTK